MRLVSLLSDDNVIVLIFRLMSGRPRITCSSFILRSMKKSMKLWKVMSGRLRTVLNSGKLSKRSFIRSSRCWWSSPNASLTERTSNQWTSSCACCWHSKLTSTIWSKKPPTKYICPESDCPQLRQEWIRAASPSQTEWQNHERADLVCCQTKHQADDQQR